MVKVYNPHSLAISFGGINISGFANGEFVSVDMNEDQFNLTVGADGESVRGRVNNGSGTVTITLLHTSQSNEDLRAILEQDRRDNAADTGVEGSGIKSLQIKDLSGRTLINCASAWIRKPPVVNFDLEATTREWVFESDNLGYEAL